MQALPTVAAPPANPYEPKTPTGVPTLSQADFLKLLTAQLTNQDPTEPVDNAQFVSQMAQFSTVNGIESLNAGLEGLAARLSAGELSGAAALIGRTATVRVGEGSVTGTVTGIAAGADGLSLSVDAAGRVPLSAVLGLAA